MILGRSAFIDCAQMSIAAIATANEISAKDSIPFFMIGFTLLFDPQYLPGAARDAVVRDVEGSVASNSYSARSRKHAFSNFGPRPVGSNAYQCACPIAFFKCRKQTVLSQLENVH